MISEEEKTLRETNKLPEDKQRFIAKHNLKLNDRNIWYIKNENGFVRPVMKHVFVERRDILALVFRMYELCAAKVTYFRSNLEFFEPYVHDTYFGFQKTQLWNAEFLLHLPSNRLIDLRSLQLIRNIDVFKDWCAKIEKQGQSTGPEFKGRPEFCANGFAVSPATSAHRTEW